MTSALPRRLSALVLLLTFAGAAPAGTHYTHATVENIDVISSMSPERTKRFLHEFVGIRRTIEDLLDTPVWQASTQVVVFGSQKEMNEFYPQETTPTAIFTKKWVCTTSPEGDTLSLSIDGPNDRIYREAALQAYASFLISRSLPNCPYWIYQGLSQFLCTLEYREGTTRLGGAIIEQAHLRPAKRIPLVETLGKHWGSKDLVGLWRLWLTEDYDGNRTRIRRLAELIRRGAPGDATTVSEAFGQPISDIQAALYKHMRRLTEATIDRPALTTALLTNVEFRPATELELTVARGMILATAKDGPAWIETSVRALAARHPDSPRVPEALACLATAREDLATAEAYWVEALAKGTHNTCAHLVALRTPLAPRSSQINLQPALTPERTAELRQIADRAVAINPGLFEAMNWAAWVEALAPEPEPSRIDAVVNSHARYLQHVTFIPLAIANLRLGRLEEATRILNEYEGILGPNGRNRPALDFLRGRIAAARTDLPSAR